MAKRKSRKTADRKDNNGSSHPLYELRVLGIGGGEVELAIWQLPSPATPRLNGAERTATLKGRPLRMALRKKETAAFPLDEDVALNLALLFRALAPMRSIDRIRMVAEGVDKMTREEAGYWLGMAVHRVYPRRVLAALRILLTTP